MTCTTSARLVLLFNGAAHASNNMLPQTFAIEVASYANIIFSYNRAYLKHILDGTFLGSQLLGIIPSIAQDLQPLSSCIEEG